MFEFDSLAYIDLQKTGSTTIVGVMRNFIKGKARYQMHMPIPRYFNPEKLTFISIRNPLATYISLFNFGAVEKKGQLYGVLMRNGFPGLYEPSIRGFERWLDFVTDPKRADALANDHVDYPVHKNYARFPTHKYIGLLSFRLIYMSVPNPFQAVRALEPGKQSIHQLFTRERVYKDYVRTENLVVDLFDMFQRNEQTIKFKRPLISAEDLISNVVRSNVSTKIDGVDVKSVSSELSQRVKDREWLIYTEFGYKNNYSGSPSHKAQDAPSPVGVNFTS